MMNRFFVISLLTIVFSAMTYAQDQAYILSNVTLIDGNGTEAQSNMSVVVEGGLIQDIYTSGEKPKPEGMKVIDLEGKYLIPGLIDAHVHVEGLEPEVMAYALKGGVTSVRDMAGSPDTLKELIEDIGTGGKPHTNIYYSIITADKELFKALMTGGEKPTFIDNIIFSISSLFAPGHLKIWSDGDDPAKLVESSKKEGVTGIKLYALLTPEVIAEITAEAHIRDILIWSHGNMQVANAKDLVEAGVDVISHAHMVRHKGTHLPPGVEVNIDGLPPKAYFSQEELDAVLLGMKEQGIVLDATLLVMERLAKNGGVPLEDMATLEQMPEEERARRKREAEVEFEDAYMVTKRANELGVKISAGTDEPLPEKAGDLPGLHEELELLVKFSGLTPVQAIMAATRNAAVTVGMGNSLGVIEVGKVADMVVLNKNPLLNISNTRSIDFVIKDGVRIE